MSGERSAGDGGRAAERPRAEPGGESRVGSPAAADVAATWNARYAISDDAVPPPAEVLSRHADRLPEPRVASASDPTRTSGPASGPASGSASGSAEPSGPGRRRDALDLACGRAGNGEWLAARGFRVTAWDASERVIEAIRARPSGGIARAEVRDVVAEPPPSAAFDVIVVARFLERALCPAIARALRPGGTLFYQTFTRGLANPDYLLGPNELLALFPTLAVLHYRERSAPGGERAEAMLVARRGQA